MRTHENINTYPKNEPWHNTQEYETNPQSDVLRQSLLATEKQGDFVIPANTIMVEMNSNTIKPDSFTGLSELASKLQDETPRHETDLHERGYGKIEAGNTMSSVDTNVRHDINKDELSSNITLLYDGQVAEGDSQTRVPSAVLVHEKLSDLQIEELRAKLPEGVPLIDGKTNTLLDEVGKAEREKGRDKIRSARDIGAFVIHGFGQYDTIRMQKAMGSLDDIQPMDWNTYLHEVNETEGYGGGFDDNSKSRQTKTSSDMPPTSGIPESPEVQAHAKQEIRTQVEIDAYKENDTRNVKKAKETIVNTAEALYGPNPGALTTEQIDKVERKVQSKLHPDRGYEAGGDSGAFKEAGVILREVRKTASAPESSPSQGE